MLFVLNGSSDEVRCTLYVLYTYSRALYVRCTLIRRTHCIVRCRYLVRTLCVLYVLCWYAVHAARTLYVLYLLTNNPTLR